MLRSLAMTYFNSILLVPIVPNVLFLIWFNKEYVGQQIKCSCIDLIYIHIKCYLHVHTMLPCTLEMVIYTGAQCTQSTPKCTN